MPLRRDYAGQPCSIARSLEVVGERWTLLIVRDAFYGVRRFSAFAEHLGIPRAVLSERLSRLVAEGVLERIGAARSTEYQLTDKGIGLWPLIYAALMWGEEHYAPDGPRRVFRHAADDGRLDRAGRCTVCGASPPPGELIAAPGPALKPEDEDDPVTIALYTPRRLLEPLEPAASAAR
jgi:DNA-binding HxlR family transcriptional regulator